MNEEGQQISREEEEAKKKKKKQRRRRRRSREENWERDKSQSDKNSIFEIKIKIMNVRFSPFAVW